MKPSIFLVFFLFSFIPVKASACSCVEHVEINWDSDAVVTAIVTSEPWTFSLTKKEYVFEVTENLLNFAQPTLHLMTRRETAACGYRYEMGVEYLIITRKNNNEFISGRCSSWPLESESAKYVLNKLNAKP
ncbi:hypothetical protein [Neptunicella sp. SCSIO 80796]|uniref:hypothetical protein n=1 Tax=Neptunicella plasticusilytica TaxID=3117012 RepID=UPI003A4D8107